MSGQDYLGLFETLLLFGLLFGWKNYELIAKHKAKREEEKRLHEETEKSWLHLKEEEKK